MSDLDKLKNVKAYHFLLLYHDVSLEVHLSIWHNVDVDAVVFRNFTFKPRLGFNFAIRLSAADVFKFACEFVQADQSVISTGS